MDEEIRNLKEELDKEYEEKERKYKTTNEIGQITQDAIRELLNRCDIKTTQTKYEEHYDLITEDGKKIEIKHLTINIISSPKLNISSEEK